MFVKKSICLKFSVGVLTPLIIEQCFAFVVHWIEHKMYPFLSSKRKNTLEAFYFSF